MAEILEIKKKHPFAGWPMIIAWLAMLIFAGHSITHMVAAGDTWVAMACGRHFINGGISRPNVEPFSANSHEPGPTAETMKKYAKVLREAAADQRQMADPKIFKRQIPKETSPVVKGSNFKAGIYEYWADKCENYENWPASIKSFSEWIHPTGWVNQNWLTHVIFYTLTHKFTGSVDEPNFNALVWWKFIIYIIAVVCVYYASRLMGVTPALAAVAACLAVFIGRSFYDVRPAGFSNVLTAVLLLILVLATYKHHLFIWLLVPVVVFWANVHGGFIYVIIVMIPFIGTHFLLMLPKKTRLIFYILGALVIFIKFFKKVMVDTIYVPQQSQIMQISMLALAVALIAGGFVFMFYGHYFVSLKLKGLIHTIAASAVAFIAALFLNPYKLTNYTHTLIVSVSKHAEMWRQVHEWHPAFAWKNPVGTSIPFLITLVAFIGFAVIWLGSLLWRKLYEKTPDNLKLFKAFTKFNFISIAIVCAWLVFLFLQLINPGFSYFLAVAVFVLLIIVSIEFGWYFIPLVGLFAAVAVLLVPAKNGYNGFYIYPFMIMPFYTILRLFYIKQKPIKLLEIGVLVLTVIISFAVMMNVTKTNPLDLKIAEIVQEQDKTWIVLRFAWIKQIFVDFWNMKPSFKPAFDNGGNSDALFSTKHLLGYLSIASLLSLIGLFLAMLKPQKAKDFGESESPVEVEEYMPAKIDLAMIIIAIITIVLSIKMRRFIALVGIMMCPVVMIFIEQLIRTSASIYNKKNTGRFALVKMPVYVKNTIITLSLLLTVSLGSFWGLKYKSIYLDPFPAERDEFLGTVFMRLTASNVKPFSACKFLRDNKISGKMFNYWTEGGFIAYGQEPDPETGKTPLQLYMDGRAQAAYDYKAYIDWMNIMGGGPHVRRALSKGRKPTVNEYKQSGKWMDSIFKKKNVWVILMPIGQARSELLKSVKTVQDWRPVFINNHQHMYVDISTKKGQSLFNGIFSNKTVFPDEFSKNITIAYNLLHSSDKQHQFAGMAALEKAINDYPSTATTEQLEYAVRFSHLHPQIIKVCSGLITDFEQNQDEHRRLPGYRNRLISAYYSYKILSVLDRENIESYKNKIEELSKDKVLNFKEYKW